MKPTHLTLLCLPLLLAVSSLITACDDETSSSKPKIQSTADVVPKPTATTTATKTSTATATKTATSTATSTGTKAAFVLSDKFDGHYDLSFQPEDSDGNSLGARQVPLELSQGFGVIEDTGTEAGISFKLRGSFSVDKNGKIESSLEVTLNGETVPVQTNGIAIAENKLKGSYLYKLNSQTVSGSLNGLKAQSSTSTSTPTTDYDGTYQVDFFSSTTKTATATSINTEKEVVLRACIFVERSAISTSIPNPVAKEIYVVKGSVQNNGSLLVLPENNSTKPLKIDGFISKTGLLTGTYQITSASGVLNGQKKEPCNDKLPEPTPAPVDPSNDLENRQHILCKKPIDTSGSGLFGKFWGIVNTLGSKSHVYCSTSTSCMPLIETKLSTYSSATDCTNACKKKESEADFANGCEGIK